MKAELLSTIGQTSLSAGVMILAAVILRLKFQEKTLRRVFCLLWDLILIRLLVPVEIPSPVSVQRFLPMLTTKPEVTFHQPMVSLAAPGTQGLHEVYLTNVSENTAAVTAAAPTAPPLSMILTGIWLIGVLALAVWVLGGHLRSRRDYAASLPVRDEFVLDWQAAHPLRRPVQVRYSDRIASPLTYGILYPVVLLPSGLDWRDKTALSWVLAHEYTHIKRFDGLRKGFLAAALCLHWFNPLVWAMYVLANRDIELACDEAVLRGSGDRAGYALALLGMEERRGKWTFAQFSQNPLEERIKAIMKHKHTSITALIAVLIVMSLATTVFATAAPEEKADPMQNPPVTSYVEPLEDDTLIMMKGETGEELYSDDNGETWMNEEGYQAKYGSWGDNWHVEWWTYDEYKEWLEQEKANLQDIIGEKGWTPSTGWFTWDQAKVDETIAMYEQQLEDIKNGILLSRRITDKDGNEVEETMLSYGSASTAMAIEVTGNEVLKTLIVSADTLEPSDGIFEKNIQFDSSELFEELKAFGVTGSENLMYYNGELVRTLVDGAPVGNEGYSIQYVYTNEQGTVDLHTLRAVIHHPDGSYDPMGDLIGLAEKGSEHFDQGLVDCAAFDKGAPPTQAYAQSSLYGDPNEVELSPIYSSAEATTTAEGSGERGRTFEEIFAQYESFGLTYQPRESGRGALSLNGEPVRSFADLKPDGGTFSYEDPYAEDGLRLVTQYDQDGNLTGLRAK